MKWAVDKIINSIAIIENINTLEKKEIDITILPFSIHEGSILINKDGIYELELNEEERRRKLIEERFKRLRNNGSPRFDGN